MPQASAEAAVSAVDAETKPATKEPRNSAITQQALPACKPVLEPIWVAFIFLSITVVLIPIGGVCLHYGLKPVELSFRYDQHCLQGLGDNTARRDHIWQNADNDSALSCTVTIDVTEDMAAPVYVYYQIKGLYQNHRRYVKSRSDLQLANVQDENQLTSLCDPMQYLAGKEDQPINPCGLVAWSFFNDTYAVSVSPVNSSTPVAVEVQSDGIAHKADVQYRFADYKPQFFNPNASSGPNITMYRGGGQIDDTPKSDERFINWMRLAALPHFRKLWGKISDRDLKAGDKLTITVTNRYNTYSFDGQKSIVLSTTTWLGGKNPFLGIAYLVTGGISFLLAVVYFVLTIVKPRKFADVSLLATR